MAEQTINGVFHTPADDVTGERKVILIKTTTEHVVDKDSGKTVKELIAENQYTDASSTKSGLMSSSNYNNLKELVDNKIVISASTPSTPCLWFKIEAEEVI